MHKVVPEKNITDEISAFRGNNTNTNFGVVARKGGNNTFKKLNNKFYRPIVGVECPAYLLHNTVQSGTGVLSKDI